MKITVVTRYQPHREVLLNRNQQSLQDQTYKDWNQIILEDKHHLGIEYANGRLIELKDDERLGDYIYILDDDDYLIDSEFFEIAAELAKKTDPEVIMVRGLWTAFGGRTLPRRCWKNFPQHGDVGSPNFLVKWGTWVEYIDHFAQPRSGDFSFIKAIFESESKVVWLDRVVVEVDQIGHQKDSSSQ